MSTKTLRVCDQSNDDGTPCNRPWTTTCVVCDTDCCATHMRNGQTFGLLLRIEDTLVDQFPLGPICYRCTSTTTSGPLAGALKHLFEDQRDNIITAIKAAVAAHALRGKKTP